jgi:signal transduction histidine kinase
MEKAFRERNLFETRHIRKDGRVFPVEVSSRGVEIGEERILLSIIRDITERKQAEEKISSAKAMLQTVFDGISDPLLMVEKDLTVRMLNEAASGYFGLADRKKTIGKFCHELAFGKREPCDGCVVGSAILEGRSIDCERKGLFDSERTEQVVVYAVDETDGGFSGAIIRISDITESRNMEKHLTRVDRLSSLGQLSGGIAHEIRNPLAGISLFIDVLSDEEKFSRTSQEGDIFEEIKLNIKKIDGIIRRILDFSKQSVISSQSKLDVGLLIEDSLKLWRSRMTKDGIKFREFFEENLSEVLGDPVEIQQVLTNLVQNALEAMEKDGTLSISAENGTLSFDRKRPAVIIRVQDSGPGIPLDQQKNIFNPFFTTKHTGTGLGLAISHRIASRHGGLISFESVPGAGTTFMVELPASPVD